MWTNDNLKENEPWDRIYGFGPQQGVTISDVWSDPFYPSVIYIAYNQGILFTTSPHAGFTFFGFSPERHPVPAPLVLRSFKGSDRRSWVFLGSTLGTYFILDDLPRYGRATTLVLAAQTYQRQYADQWWFWPVNVVGGLIATYIVALGSMLVLLSINAPPVLGRGWLRTLVAKPLTISPPLGRWVIFLGYRRRLRRVPTIDAVSRNYFGLSATLSDGSRSAADSSGIVLHSDIVKQLQQQNCLLLLGRPGSGKSSVLAKLALLSGDRSALRPLPQLTPILIAPEYYKGNLLEAASRVLRERDRVPVDSSEMVTPMCQCDLRHLTSTI